MMPSVVPKPSSSTWLPEIVDGVVPMPPVAMNSSRTQDHDDVVEDGGPHGRGEGAARVEDPAGQRAHTVEEDLRDEEKGEDHHQVVFGPGDRVGVQVNQQARGERGHHGENEQGAGGQGEHPLVVGLAAVGVPFGRADQQRDHHAGQDAAQHEVVHRVGQRVGVVVRVGHADHAQRVDQHQRAQETGATRRERAHGHHGAGPEQAAATLRAGSRPVRGRAAGAGGAGRGWPGPPGVACRPGSGSPGSGPAGPPGLRSPSWITPLPATPLLPA